KAAAGRRSTANNYRNKGSTMRRRSFNKVNLSHAQTCLYIAGMLLLASCSNTKRLAEGESLFLGSEVKITDNQADKKEKDVLKSDLQDAVAPKPNRKTLGMRLRLSLYNFAGEPKKEKGIRYWLRNKVGEPPVLTSTFDAE